MYIAPSITREGLVLCVDFGNIKSYNENISVSFDNSDLSFDNNIVTFDQSQSLTGSYIVKNLANKKNNGVLVNSPVFSIDGGGCLEFDGISNYVDLGDILLFFPSGNLSRSLSVELVVKITENVNCIYYGNQTISNERLFIARHDGFFDFGYGNFTWGASNIAAGSRLAWPLNTWAHVVVNVDNGVPSLYANGVYTFTRNTDTTVNLTGNLPLGAYLGNNGDTSWSNVGSNKIALNRIYNRALTENEIKRNFNAIRTRFGL